MRPALALCLTVAACGGATAKPAPTPAPAPEPAPTPAPAPEPAPPPAPLDPPPWAETVPAKSVPKVFLAEWKKAENRETCPLLVPTDLGEKGAGAMPRRASFYGGWAVAYDKKGLPGTKPTGDPCDTCGRGVFGVAGAGVSKTGATPFAHELKWADGSQASYGEEGGSGPSVLAYLSIKDADCLYNVWSYLGEEHLLKIIRGLRRVR